MSFKVELKAKNIAGWVLLVIGLAMIFYSFYQASMTYNTINKTFSNLKEAIEEIDTDTATLQTLLTPIEEIESPLFTEALFWFFMMMILVLSGFIISNTGLKLTKTT